MRSRRRLTRFSLGMLVALVALGGAVLAYRRGSVPAEKGWSTGAAAAATDPTAAAELDGTGLDGTGLDGTAAGAGGAGATALEERVKELERSIEAGDDDVASRTELAALHLESARRTGDLAGYERAAFVIDEALASSPDDPAALAVLATVRYGLHQFAQAAEITEQVLERSPGERQAIAVLGDARLELGDLTEAGERYEDLAGLAGPVPEVLVRQARLAWLQGDVEGALDQADRALTTSFLVGADGPTTAYYESQLATYRLEAGDAGAAVAMAEAAVTSDPASPVAQGVLGRALAATGRLDEAIAAYEAAVAIVPSPKQVAALGDLYAVTGQPARAEEQYETVLLIADLASEGGAVVYNRDLARFLADHDRQLDRAVELARGELAVRPDVYGYDTLAWALHASGDTEGAVEAIAPALATGLVDAQVLYHAGMIHAAAGDDEAAVAFLQQALALNPNFDPLHAPLAAERLAALEDV